MPSNIFLILPVILASHGITLLLVQSGYRKKETTVIYGLFFLLNALLGTILIYAVPYKLIFLECLLGFALFFTFFFLFMAWNSIVVPAKKWLLFSKKMMLLGLVAGTFHAIITLFVSEGGLLRTISLILMVAATAYLVFVCMKRMIKVNLQFLNYIMDNYSYIENSLIRYRNGIITSVFFVTTAFLSNLMIIFFYSMPLIIIFALYQLIYFYRGIYIIFNFRGYKNDESNVTVYYANFLNDTNTKEFHLFFPEDAESLLEDKHEELRNRLITYFEESKPYIFKKLMMNDVARDLNTNRTYISQIINTDFGTTFFNFVNVFRIEEAKRQIEETSSYSLKAIADSCGFSSYTTFVKYHKMYNTKSADWYVKRKSASK